MKTVTIHFTGGKPFCMRMPDEAADALIKELSDPLIGTTTITGETTTCTVNRAQMTYAEAVQ
jgi:tRNA A37 threonylcarbamoyladenosine synthetase subunit TsaC/SUA5/YrdC